MYDIYESQSCPGSCSVTQLGIIKSIIQNRYDLVFNCIAKLYTAEKKIKRFLYSDLSGCLCLVLNLTTLNFHFLLYDLETYETLFNAILYDNFINGYTKLRQDFHCFEVINGFIGFYFEDEMDANQLIDIITKQQNEAYAKQRSNEYKTINEEKVKEITMERIKEIKDYLLNEYNIEDNNNDNDKNDKDKQLVINEGKITESISHFYYNDFNEKVTYIGNKSIGQRLIKENKLPKDIIEVVQGEDKGINDIDSFISIMAKHLINEDNAIKQLTNIKKAKSNIIGSRTFDKTISDLGYNGDDIIMPSPSKQMCRNTLLSIRNNKTIVSKDSSSIYNYQEAMNSNNTSNRQSIYSIYEPNKMRNTLMSRNSNSNSNSKRSGNNKNANSDMRSSHFNMRIKKQISWRVDNKKNRLGVDLEEETDDKDKDSNKDKRDSNLKKEDDIYKPIDSIIDEETIQ